MEEKFWRLLSALEHLTCNETVALRGRNFSYLSKIQEMKSEILPEFLAIAERLGIDGNDSRLKGRMAHLMDANQSNAWIADGYLRANATARRDAESALRRLRDLRKIYGCDPGGGKQTFYAA